jgi:hypothetical protein
MKTIEQLLELTKNPYYKFTEAEQAVLDDFLAQQRAKHSTDSTKKNSKLSDSSTPVTVRNIVQKTIPRVQDAPEPTESVS